MQLPAPLRMLDARIVATEPVSGVLLAVLVVGHDLQTGSVQVACLGKLDGFACRQPRTARIRYVPNSAQVPGGLDRLGGRDTAGIVDESSQRRRVRTWRCRRHRTRERRRRYDSSIFEDIPTGYGNHCNLTRPF
ncbi:Uncharacterised protein [Mycobacteroides abscessus subsp. abscessus]|nr:Uncharacterised protein [Mycobacteroides abscessus subsp. abscessus]